MTTDTTTTSLENTNTDASLINLVVGMFNAASGASYLEALKSLVKSPEDLLGIAHGLSASEVFKNVHPDTETPDDFANAFLSQFKLETNAVAVDWVKTQFDLGLTKGEIVYQAVDFLSKTTNPDFAEAQTILNAKTEVAQYYSVDKAVAETDLTVLQQVVADVVDAESAATAIKHIDNPQPANVAPEVADVTLGEGHGGADYVISATDLLANATDADGDTLTVTEVTLEDQAQGTLADNGDGTYTFTPAEGVSGDVKFVFKVSDGVNDAVGAVAAVNLTPANTAPTVADVTLGESQNGTDYVFSADDLLATATDADGDTLTVTEVTLEDETQGALVDNGDGTYTFTAAEGVSGDVKFAFKVSDGVNDAVGAVAAVTVPAAPVNTPPTVTDVALGESEGGKDYVLQASDLLANAADAESDELTVTEVTLEDEAQGTLADNGDGTYTFTPAEGVSGDVKFAFKVSDGVNEAVSAVATVMVTAVPVNTPPTVTDVALGESPNGKEYVFSADSLLVNATDADANDVLTVTEVTLEDSTQGTLTHNEDGTYTFMPAAGVTGDVKFAFKVSDGVNDAVGAMASVAVLKPVNTAPTVADVALGESKAGASYVLSAAALLKNAVDAEGDTLAVTEVTLADPTKGTLVHEGETYTFTPAKGVAGDVKFAFKVSDSVNDAVNATATVVVLNNTAPSVSEIAFDKVKQGTNYSFTANTLLKAATDAESDPLSVTTVSLVDPTQGTLEKGEDGSYTFKPADGVAGNVKFAFAVTDGVNDPVSSTATLSVIKEVLVVNDLQADAGNGDFAYTVSASGPLVASIGNFAAGDMVDFGDSLLEGLVVDADVEGDGVVHLFVPSEMIDVVLTGIPVGFDVAGQTVATFNTFFGSGSLV